MIRPLLSLERLSFSEKEGKVCYRYGKKAKEVERMDYLGFIELPPVFWTEKRGKEGALRLRPFGALLSAGRPE